jgi:hypothetical protein
MFQLSVVGIHIIHKSDISDNEAGLLEFAGRLLNFRVSISEYKAALSQPHIAMYIHCCFNYIDMIMHDYNY